jgi:hypothetical protein
MTVRALARLAAAVILAVAGCLSATAPAGAQSDRSAIERIRPLQIIRAVLGSKRATGFFIAANGECAVTLMIAEEIDATAGEPMSAARLLVSLHPGQSISLDSEEGEAMRLSCQGTGDAMELAVRRGSLAAAARSAR